MTKTPPSLAAAQVTLSVVLQMTPGGIDCNVLNGGTLYASQLQFLWQGRWCHWRFLCSVPNPSHSNNNNNNNKTKIRNKNKKKIINKSNR